MIKENPYENICHKLYLLAYFPLSPLLLPHVFNLWHEKGGSTFLESWQPVLNGNQDSSSKETVWNSSCGRKRSALTPNVTFLCPSLASLLLITYHPTTALPFLMFVSWLFFVEATELMIPMYLSLRNVLENRSALWTFFSWTKGTEAPNSKKKFWPTVLGLPETFPVVNTESTTSSQTPQTPQLGTGRVRQPGVDLLLHPTVTFLLLPVISHKYKVLLEVKCIFLSLFLWKKAELIDPIGNLLSYW